MSWGRIRNLSCAVLQCVVPSHIHHIQPSALISSYFGRKCQSRRWRRTARRQLRDGHVDWKPSSSRDLGGWMVSCSHGECGVFGIMGWICEGVRVQLHFEHSSTGSQQVCSQVNGRYGSLQSKQLLASLSPPTPTQWRKTKSDDWLKHNHTNESVCINTTEAEAAVDDTVESGAEWE